MISEHTNQIKVFLTLITVGEGELIETRPNLPNSRASNVAKSRGASDQSRLADRLVRGG
jgi:hypothetical protein